MRDNFIFYRSFYEAAKFLSSEDRLKLYEAIFELALNDEERLLDGPSAGMMTLIKPQIEANTKRYEAGKKGAEHGKKGGRPPKKDDGVIGKNPIGDILENPNKTANNNVNVNKNVNVNDNVNTSGDEKKEIITLVLDTGDEFSVSEEQFKEWQRLYPKVDVLQELRKMKGWCDANPKKRKTKSGIKRFITGWLAREQSEKKETDTGLPDWYDDTKQQPNDPDLENEIDEMLRGLTS